MSDSPRNRGASVSSRPVMLIMPTFGFVSNCSRSGRGAVVVIAGIDCGRRVESGLVGGSCPKAAVARAPVITETESARVSVDSGSRVRNDARSLPLPQPRDSLPKTYHCKHLAHDED